MKETSKWIASAVLLGLASCQTRPPTPEIPAPAPVIVEPGVPAPGSRALPVIAEESLLQILVYRGGAMARLGHNHVIASHHLAGAVFVTQDTAQTRFDLNIPVNELTVDEPAMREQAGAEFPPGVPQTARDGTRKNLMSEALLDGERYPSIRLRTTDVVAAGAGFDVGVEITIKDQVRHVRVPVAIERRDGSFIARGEFPLRQSELGLKPFSAAMGTLLVLDEMRIRFEVTAR